MIWLEGVYSEAIHFGCAFALAWVLVYLTSGIFSTWFYKGQSRGISDTLWVIGLYGLSFGLGGLFHLWLDTLQRIF